jgi:pyruvate dehydrogenase E1 component
VTSLAERLLAPLPRDCRIVTVIDGHPATLSWLGGVAGHAVLPLGVERFGQTGTIADLYRANGIDAAAIIERVGTFTSGRPVLAFPARPRARSGAAALAG